MDAGAPESFLQGGGDMGARMRAHDWSASPLGPPSGWPQSLRTAVQLLLECRLPMYLAWGSDFLQFYNDAYAPILGAKHPAALGGRAPDTWHEIWPTIGPMWRQVQAGESFGFDDFQLTIERYGYPEDCWFNFSYSPVRDEQQRVAGVLVTFAETTRRVLNEARLRFLDDLGQATRGLERPEDVMRVTAERLGRHLGADRCAYANVLEDQDTFDVIGDFTESGVHSIVGRYRFRDFGDAVLRLMQRNEGYVNEDVDRDPRTAGTDLAAYRATRIQSVICLPLHKDGRFVAAMAVHQARPRRWSAHDVELVQTVVDRCWEALERIRAARALSDAHRRLSLALRAGGLGDWSWDAASDDVVLGDAAADIYGVPRGVPIARARLRELLHEDDRDRARQAVLEAIRTDSDYRIEYRLRGTDGALRWVCASGIAQTGADARLSGMTGVVQDITAWREAQEQLQRALDERKALLESERAARHEAERAGALKDEFLATLSHELRTPLSAILGWVHILRGRLAGASPELAKGVEVIDRSTRVQVKLIDDLLDMSRITSGKLRLELQPVLPATFVQAALEVVRPTADAAGVALVASLEPVAAVQGDAARLQQTVWNLLANAVKFTPRGGRVAVALRGLAGHAEIVVEDTGSGIPATFLPHLFERFRQADGSITRRHGGLGLGLSIVRHLVELHGGTVRAESAGEGRGARFTIRLPLAQETAGAAVASATRAEVPTAAPQLAGIRVVVVDDEADARDLLRRLLEDCGAQVATAGDAEAGLRAVQDLRPHLLLSDIGMPDTDGYELLRRVRRLPDDLGGCVPAVALTAFARPEDRTRALAAGFAEHVTKPMEPARVLATVARLATRR
ncbi:MAG TPA: ATP-binding protein [Ramlibacter sp.]|jgi:signal transduction histidine kinase/ActR/RegA family two-component response regulator|uniref:hybrid sensor histidine kinase/response regulator n=1 Tax=Ramlibacter sp. TaxID=1917967 RepID=UPI002D60BDA3|nr:ATP-binding protein [Ramlibacter sp.]HZY20266.1 ATP-binding protein [Ramlibacter sp.]